MTCLIIGGVLMLLFVISVIHEPRKFFNAILFMVALIFLFFGFTIVTAHIGYIQIFIVLTLFIVVPLTIVVMSFLLIINGFVMIKKEGFRLSNLLSLILGFAIIGGITVTVLLFFTHTVHTVLMSLIWLGAILSAYFSFTFLSLLCYSKIYTSMPKKKNCDYIIVHGCGLADGIKVSPLLKGRVDKAVEIFHKTGDKAKLVLSGGQGGDEKISEAQAMKNYLLSIGFDESMLILEDKSATTYENLKNVRDMFDKDGIKHKYLFVTNNYHVFRTGLFARKLKMDADGVGCKTARYYWPSAFIREYIAIMVKFKWPTIIIVALWLVAMIVSLLPI